LIIARPSRGGAAKARIFEIYLNVIEWGDGIWGAEAAARTYFGVPASALNAEQSALLAGAIINPRALNPAHPTARLIASAKIILSRMGEVTRRRRSGLSRLRRRDERRITARIGNTAHFRRARAGSEYG
jgi:monofunctional biosynthetic peptidoglycan transglycosylase